MIHALIELPRPLNCLITFVSVLTGGWIASYTISEPLILAALSAALITGGGNTLNDLYGITADQINKPHRPLPSGRLSLFSARLETGALLISGLLLATQIPHPGLAIASIAIASLILYNAYLKGVPLIGNLTVSALGGLAFLYGGAAVQDTSAPILIATFAGLFHLGREILKDLEDRVGDRHLSGSTIPIAWGQTQARILITATFSILIITTPLPTLVGSYNRIYFACIILLNLLLTYVTIRLWQSNTPQTLHFLSKVLKAGMLLGLMAFLLAKQ